MLGSVSRGLASSAVNHPVNPEPAGQQLFRRERLHRPAAKPRGPHVFGAGRGRVHRRLPGNTAQQGRKTWTYRRSDRTQDDNCMCVVSRHLLA